MALHEGANKPFRVYLSCNYSRLTVGGDHTLCSSHQRQTEGSFKSTEMIVKEGQRASRRG